MLFKMQCGISASRRTAVTFDAKCHKMVTGAVLRYLMKIREADAVTEV